MKLLGALTTNRRRTTACDQYVSQHGKWVRCKEKSIMTLTVGGNQYQVCAGCTSQLDKWMDKIAHDKLVELGEIIE